MSRPRYHFISRWTVAASPGSAYDALHEVMDYPTWWPEVHEARKIDEHNLWLRTRSFLPYDLAFSLRRDVADRAAGILEARLEGDLEGRIRWTVVQAGAGTAITFDEDVVTNKPLLNRLAPIARPAFVINHALMMSHGQAGLRRHLRGPSSPV